MALPAGRVGVAPDQVDRNGNIKSPPPSPTAKGMLYQEKKANEAYSYGSDTLATFIINNNNSEEVVVDYTPTEEIGPCTLYVAAIANSDGTYDCIFTLWVPKNVSVEVNNRSVTMTVIATIF